MQKTSYFLKLAFDIISDGWICHIACVTQITLQFLILKNHSIIICIHVGPWAYFLKSFDRACTTELLCSICYDKMLKQKAILKMCGKFENFGKKFDVIFGPYRVPTFATRFCRLLISLHAKFQLRILNSYLKCLRTRSPSKNKKIKDFFKPEVTSSKQKQKQIKFL